jgi:UDP-glucose 4-epimerase
MTTLVTGVAGFVGRHLRPLLDGEEIVGIDRELGADLTDPGTAMRLAVQEIDTVYHLAAHHFVPWCRLHPVETLENNVHGMMNLLAGLEQHPPERIVFASSAAVYGLNDATRLESDPLDPVDVYGWSKVIGEQLLEAFSQRHPETTCVSARLANVVGPDDPHEHIVPVLLAARGTDEPPILGNLWPRRDYVHVDDVADALVALSTLDPGYHVYNVGTGLGTTVWELLGLLGWPQWSVDPAKMRDNDGHLVLSVRKITTDTGWVSRHSLQEVLV